MIPSFSMRSKSTCTSISIVVADIDTLRVHLCNFTVLGGMHPVALKNGLLFNITWDVCMYRCQYFRVRRPLQEEGRRWLQADSFETKQRLLPKHSHRLLRERGAKFNSWHYGREQADWEVAILLWTVLLCRGEYPFSRHREERVRVIWTSYIL